MARFHFAELVRRKIPVLVWLPRYTRSDALSDVLAGLAVGLTLIPQAIAYAALAGLGPQFGLYSAFAGSLVYIALGTCREVNIGPTALISLLTYTYAKGIPEYVVLLCFLSGCVTLAFGLLRLGFLVELVSIPVVSGFTSAASLIIACSQIKGLIGITGHGEGFVDIWKGIYDNVHKARMPDLILSCCCIITLLTLKRLKEVKVSNPKFITCLWFVGTARNALVVVVCALVAYVFEVYSNVPFLLTGHIQPGLPNVGPPEFSIISGNRTIEIWEMCQNLGSGIIIVPLVSIIGNVAISKAFSHGRTLDATQEMLTLGICNIVGSFFSSMPVTGSFSRSAVNNASGVRTPMGGLYTGILVILALSLLTPYFYYIPRATLSSVIICAVMYMIEFGIILPIWKCSRKDLIPTLITFLSCLFVGVEIGILIGIAVDLAILIYFNARPPMEIEHRNQCEPAYIAIRPCGGLLFPAIDFLRETLTKSVAHKRNNLKTSQALPHIVLDCKHIHRIDFTAIQGIKAVLADLKEQNCNLVILHPKQDILTRLQILTKEPILTAHSEIELVSILRHFQTANDRVPGNDTILEISNVTSSKERTGENEISSTHL